MRGANKNVFTACSPRDRMTLLTELQRCLLLVPSFIAYVLIVVKRTQDSWNAGKGQVDCRVFACVFGGGSWAAAVAVEYVVQQYK